ncbi:hypothetical protein PTSG_07275 [Salpingoeca rosetta]|uniref:Uncharacterized protein n=1 Tax=Salpingoeca rosetta (strain ATCC 50818 / BSB-021) TaxID=946362 RepID=F2UIY6_SALR5|nr:uncharacterized protein PTSG_07275 [Salpingoeca rosetta]EGD76934.1 hypothetical protein PTSG_07275 [Salpingoeca rosetta]|eukprot:XP_004990774.1 hypothetical protein PTSG_07275 [Salpingoeca rosetta]
MEEEEEHAQAVAEFRRLLPARTGSDSIPHSSNIAPLDRTQLLALMANSSTPVTFTWKKSVLQLMHYAFLGVATARDDLEFCGGGRGSGAKGMTYSDDDASDADNDGAGDASRGARRRPSRVSRRGSGSVGDASAVNDIGGHGDGDDDEDDAHVPLFRLPPPVPPSAIDPILELGSSLASAGVAMRSGLSAATGVFGSLVLGAGSTFGRAATTAGSTLVSTIRSNLAALHRLRERSQQSRAGNEALDLTPEEQAVLDAKLAEMEKVLEEELKQLQEQEVDIYVEKFTEAMEMSRKLAEMERVMQQKNEEILLQREIVALEMEENRLNPEPDDSRAELSERLCTYEHTPSYLQYFLQ